MDDSERIILFQLHSDSFLQIQPLDDRENVDYRCYPIFVMRFAIESDVRFIAREL